MKLKSEQIAIETTNLCPAHCIMCPRELYTNKPGVMDMDLFKKIIGQAAESGVKTIEFGGFGDPFTDPLLFERCQYIRGKIPDAKTCISSTCFLMPPARYNDVAKYIDTLKISFYGITEKTFEKVHRGSIKFEKSLNNILGFLDKTKNLKKKPYTVGLFVLVDENKHEMNDWIDFWQPKLNEVYVWKPHNWVDVKNYRKMNYENQKTCGRALVGPPFIHTDGRVGVCCFDFNSKLIIGDMNKQTLEEIFHSEPYLKLKKANETGNFKGYLCEKCDQTNYDSSVLVYSTNKERAVGKINSNFQNLRKV